MDASGGLGSRSVVGLPATGIAARVRAGEWSAVDVVRAPTVRSVGPPGAGSRLLWLAGELERSQPWRRHAPVCDPTASPAPAPV